MKPMSIGVPVAVTPGLDAAAPAFELGWLVDPQPATTAPSASIEQMQKYLIGPI
jgi:hypothetical protein